MSRLHAMMLNWIDALPDHERANLVDRLRQAIHDMERLSPSHPAADAATGCQSLQELAAALFFEFAGRHRISPPELLSLVESAGRQCADVVIDLCLAQLARREPAADRSSGRAA